MKKLVPFLIGGILIFATGCGGVTFGSDQSREDASKVVQTCLPNQVGRCVDKNPPRVVAFNNHYPNVETKCDGYGHRIFVSTHNSSTGRNTIVLPDPSCPGYVKGQEPIVISNGG
jgi:hypothetical protein